MPPRQVCSCHFRLAHRGRTMSADWGGNDISRRAPSLTGGSGDTGSEGDPFDESAFTTWQAKHHHM